MMDEPRLELRHTTEGESGGDLAATLPASVAAYIQSTNACDLDALLATFVDDAPVNDQPQNYWGKEVIAAWVARNIIGERMTIKVTNIIQHYNYSIVTVHVDDIFEKPGPPGPILLYFSFFTSRQKKITKPIIFRNQSGT
jgi:hypothetical protein